MEPNETFLLARERPAQALLTEQPPRRVAHLHLRPALTEDEMRRAEHAQRRVTWNANVREFPNQRVSKSCCIFHKKKLFGESSSSSSSCSSSDSEILPGEGEADRGFPPHEPTLPKASNDDPSKSGGLGETNDNSNAGGCGHSHGGGKRHHPKCTKEHCYCGTRFH
ncbi:unnamed protein product [Phytomonas sp. EM1]|nr:unnamed protein product [Phytomonas sp. EM1]|eukprot:CCW65496.1 unnamed protein product [Phytomonas sp. isolate EM1]